MVRTVPVLIFIYGILAPSSPVLSGLVINVVHAKETDPLKIQNLPISTGEFTSTTLPLLSVLQSGVLGNLTKDVLERLKDFLDSRPIASFDRSECVVSAITGGTDGITKKGNLIFGTSCDDKIDGSNKNEIIYTLGGIDLAYAKGGNDIIYGGTGDDRLYGQKGDDIVVAGPGGNLVDGGPGNDVVIGGAGNNLLLGGNDNDQLISGVGTTIMDGGTGTNSFDCGIAPGKGIVLDYNPDNGDTISGQCKIVNNIGTDFPNDVEITPPD